MPGPKKKLNIRSFAGGLVTHLSEFDINNDAYQSFTNVVNDKVGRAEKRGATTTKGNTTQTLVSGGSLPEHSMGLAYYRAEFDKDGTSASTPFYYAYRINSDRSDVSFIRTQDNGTNWVLAWDVDASGQWDNIANAKTQHINIFEHNQVLRISDGQFEQDDHESKWYGFIKRDRFGQGITYDEPEKPAVPLTGSPVYTKQSNAWHVYNTRIRPPVLNQMSMTWDKDDQVKDTANVGLYIHHPDHAANIFGPDQPAGTFNNEDLYTVTYIYDYVQESALAKSQTGEIGIQSMEDSGDGTRMPGIQIVLNVRDMYIKDEDNQRITGINVYWKPKGEVDYYLVAHCDMGIGWSNDYKAIRVGDTTTSGSASAPVPTNIGTTT
jgi:hypothetical protein